MTDITNKALIFGDALEVRFANNGATGVIEGYASTFGGEPDSFGDVVAPGAFTKTLIDHKAAGTAPAMLWSHDLRAPIGKWTSLAEDSTGLRVSGVLNMGVQLAREAHALATDGALALSIGYKSRLAGRTLAGDRLLKQVDLAEVSLVAIPANTAARILSVKSAVDASSIQDPRAFEQFLRDAGFSRAIAKSITARGFKSAATCPRDADTAAVSLMLSSLRESAAQLQKSTKG